MTLSSTAASASATLSLLLLLLHAAVTTATLCMSCSWSGVEHPSKICAAEDISSLTADQKLWIHAINCGQQNCNVRRVNSRSTGKVHSFSRGCSIKPPQSTKCSNDVYFTTCETICSTDNCNVKESLPTYKPKSTTKRHSYNNAGGSGIVGGRAVATSRCFVSATASLFIVYALLF